MTPLVLLAAAATGGVGAVARWSLEHLANRRGRSGFPWGVFWVNIAGSLLIGIVTGALAGTVAAQIVGTGLLGGFTTFSSVASATAAMLDRRDARPALLNAAGMLVLALAAAAVGFWIGTLAS